MSDDWNFHDAMEESARDNAGHLAVLATLMARSQRAQQLQVSEASLRQQAEIAKTEAQRLEIEKQRLELEKLKQQAEKDEREAVRLLRIMMTEVGSEFNNFEIRGHFKGSPQGLRRDYAMAVLMSKLEVVRSRSGDLNDLNDLKELSRLENLAQDLAATHFPGGHPLAVTRAKWAELEAWMRGVERIGMRVKETCAAVYWPTATQLPSPTDLATLEIELECFASQLNFDLKQHASSLPERAAPEGILLDELAEQARLEDLSRGKNPIRAKAFTNCWHQVAVTGTFVQNVQAAIQELQLRKNEASVHDYALQELAVKLEEGRLSDASASLVIFGEVMFDDLDYSPVSDLQKLNQTLEELKTAKWKDVVLKVAELRRKYSKAGPKSELSQVFKATVARAARGKKLKETMVLVGVATLSCIAILFIYFRAEEKLEAAENTEALRSLMGSGQPGSKLSVRLPGGVMMDMVWYDPGASYTGRLLDEAGRTSDEDQEPVTVSRGFWLGWSEVTQEQWEVMMGNNPSQIRGKKLPVERFRQKDALSFVEKLNESRLLPAGWVFTLYNHAGTSLSSQPNPQLRTAAVRTYR
jgi:hypothetical protein